MILRVRDIYTREQIYPDSKVIKVTIPPYPHRIPNCRNFDLVLQQTRQPHNRFAPPSAVISALYLIPSRFVTYASERSGKYIEEIGKKHLYAFHRYSFIVFFFADIIKILRKQILYLECFTEIQQYSTRVFGKPSFRLAQKNPRI